VWQAPTPQVAMSTVRRANNFDLLRLGAAALVVFHHCFSVTGAREPLNAINAGDTFGIVGVLFFFSISGYLVTQSWSRTRRLVPFAAKRALRLLPALIVCVTLVALVLGSAVTALPTPSYLTSAETYHYIVDNSLLHTVYTLPGVFAHVPEAHIVNASLWTIPIEARAYIGVVLLGLIGLWRRSWVWLLLGAGLLTVNSGVISVHVPLGHTLLSLVGGARTDARYMAAFCIGAALFLQRERVALRWDFFLAGLAAYLLSLLASPALHQSVAIVTIPYLTLVLAFRTPGVASLPARVGDLSYGIYLYAFVVQQVLSEYLTHNPWAIFAMAMPLSAALAFVSWHVIEAPALRLKPVGSAGRRRAVATEPPRTLGESRIQRAG
jgi:peptidoglycan/LPS O-acetylase OafA/YrhL